MFGIHSAANEFQEVLKGVSTVKELTEKHCKYENGVFTEVMKSRMPKNIGSPETARGRCLMDLKVGLHDVKISHDPVEELIIGIHGFKATGKEWITPFHILDKPEVDMHFFRWDYLGSMSEAGDLFQSELDELLATNDDPTTPLTIIAHSCGGVLLVSLLSEIHHANPIDVQIVASPLGGLGLFTVCKPHIPAEIPANITVTQWRTHKNVDKVFMWFPKNPQVVDLYPSTVHELSATDTQGRTIGHVNSLERVAIEMLKLHPNRFGDPKTNASLNNADLAATKTVVSSENL